MKACLANTLRQLIWREREKHPLITLDAAAARYDLTEVALWRLFPWMEDLSWAGLFPEHFRTGQSRPQLLPNVIAFPAPLNGAGPDRRHALKNFARSSILDTRDGTVLAFPGATDRLRNPEA